MRALLAVVCLIFIAAGAQAQTPVIAAGGVLNGASFAREQAVSPGALISIFGSNLATANATADSIPLSMQLGDVKVTVGGFPAPLMGVFRDPVNGDQINAQLPWEVLPLLPPTSNGNVQVVVTRGTTASAAVSVPVTTAAPGIFSTQFGVGQAIAYGNSDGIIAAATGSIPGLTTRPAKINDPLTLQILATGLGPVTPSVPSGGVPGAGVIARTVGTPRVFVGGVEAQVVFSGLSPYVGVYQLNIVIANGTPTGSAVPLQVEMNGIRSTDKVTIAVQQ